MNTPTPRTDEAEFSFDTFNGVDPWEGERWIKVVPSKISAELERELTAVSKERDEARAEMIRWMSIAEGRGRTDDDDTGKAMAKLIRQRDEAREGLAEEIKFHHRTHSELVQTQCQMQDVIRERDEAREEMIRWMSIAEGRGRTDETLSNQ